MQQYQVGTEEVQVPFNDYLDEERPERMPSAVYLSFKLSSQSDELRYSYEPGKVQPNEYGLFAEPYLIIKPGDCISLINLSFNYIPVDYTRFYLSANGTAEVIVTKIFTGGFDILVSVTN
ncbi:MAG: hypothetical protein ACRC78_25795 [Planktothrix sp.]